MHYFKPSWQVFTKPLKIIAIASFIPAAVVTRDQWHIMIVD
jgi:hypothetical protein